MEAYILDVKVGKSLQTNLKVWGVSFLISLSNIIKRIMTAFKQASWALPPSAIGWTNWQPHPQTHSIGWISVAMWGWLKCSNNRMFWNYLLLREINKQTAFRLGNYFKTKNITNFFKLLVYLCASKFIASFFIGLIQEIFKRKGQQWKGVNTLNKRAALTLICFLIASTYCQVYRKH